MTVTNADQIPDDADAPVPAERRRLRRHDIATAAAPSPAYQPLDPYSDAAGCADVYVNGTYARDLTIASAKDIIVNGDIGKSGDHMLGLIANNFVRVYHPVNRSDRPTRTSCTECLNDGTPTNVSIDAAILALSTRSPSTTTTAATRSGRSP